MTVFPEFLQDILIYGLLICLTIVSFCLAIFNNLFSKIVLLASFSLIITLIYALLDSPDVAMTETAVNATIGTIFLLAAASRLNSNFESDKKYKLIAKILCISLFALFVKVSLDLPDFSDSTSPVFSEVYKHYINNTYQEIGIPSFVTAILSSYRGFDTLGETMVIFVAGLIVGMILKKDKLEDQIL
ncbi:MAG: DUF4040 domain-containing protein [Sphingobacteriia bacterium]|nr:DUF4040 domain-containing protein [Sphingobacteriia bacterium]